MEQPLSFFNLSLRKLLSTEQDSFIKAKISILFTVLIISLAKLLIAISTVWYHGQYLQLGRALVVLVVYAILMKLLLANKVHMHKIAHVMVWIGLLLIWSNVFIYAQAINIITLQFVFMLILGSFYLLGTGYGTLYALLSSLPVIMYTFFGEALPAPHILPNELASPGYEIIVLLNFVTIIISHYLFQKAFISNIAEKEALNNQLQIAVKEANQAAESKSDFLSTMSHELRTPLNSVIGMTELLMDDPHTTEQAENLKILNFSAASLHSLINDILDFNKLGSEKLNLEAINVDLYSLINDICSGLRFQTKEKGVSLVLDLDENIKDQHIITDPTRITQIIYNLAGNAIKFTSEGSVTIQLKVTSKNDDSISIRFSIIDTGIGISADKQEAIFEPFTQASSSTTRNFGGTGLGLAIVKRLLLLFDSKINLESVPGKGSNFFFDISFKLDEQPVEIQSVITDTSFDLTGVQFLVAEDNPMNRLLVKKVFSKWNNEPVFAMNGQEALEKLALQSYDMVLMDIHMPVMDGYEAARAIRNMQDPVRSRVPIIALTASVSNNLYDKIKDAGMDDYVLKPFNSKELYSKLKDIALRTQNKVLE